MAGIPRPLRDGRRGTLTHALGVTRVARLTGLDRTGVEVASAVRPDGHVLQVTNGKGARFEDAALGALAEAAELWAAERPGPMPLASAAELRARLGEGAVIGPGALAGGAADPAWEALRVAWCEGVPLEGGAPVAVPAQAVYCPPPGGPLLGPAVLTWTSNGMGAHPDPDRAALHALLEAAERDQLARALPEGFTEGELARRLIDPRGLPDAAPRAAALAASLEARGLRVHLLDLTPAGRGAGGLGLPVAGALLGDPGGPVPLAAGYACRPGRDEALVAALLEAAQSRATEIHGAREDVLHGDRASAAPLAQLCAAVRPSRRAAALPSLAAPSPAAALRRIAARLRATGLGPAVRVALEGPPGLHVVKIVAPGLLLSELL
ncbi:YcaO-like family protein [Anaeromyxobacter sp. Red801]|uniref:YcaO-like family protein n=1 Tax=Anaeromyxobacter sp. Red801 TaxID=3411632 RepID=UPI003BA13E4B